MSETTLGHMIQALYHERDLPAWERDFVIQAYFASSAGSRAFHLTLKDAENIQAIFERVYH